MRSPTTQTSARNQGAPGAVDHPAAREQQVAGGSAVREDGPGGEDDGQGEEQRNGAAGVAQGSLQGWILPADSEAAATARRSSRGRGPRGCGRRGRRPPPRLLAIAVSPELAELRERADQVEEHARLGAVAVVELVDGQDLDQVLGQQAAVALGEEVVGRVVVLGVAARGEEEAGVGVERSRR